MSEKRELSFKASDVLPIFAAKLLTSPLEVLKLNMQLNNFRSYPKLIQQIWRQDGLRFYFSGNLMNSIRFFPHAYATYKLKPFWERIFIETRSKKYTDNEYFSNPYPIRAFLAGAFTGLSALVFSHPFDVLRTRLSTDMKLDFPNKKYSGLLHCMLRTAYEENPRNNAITPFYRGFIFGALSEVPYRAIFFGGYNIMKYVLKNDTTFLQKWTAAQFAVAIATIATYPLDTMKRLAMKSGEHDHNGVQLFQYRRPSHAILWLLHERGLFAFYRGMSMSLVRTPLSALALAGFDQYFNSKEILSKINES